MIIKEAFKRQIRQLIQILLPRKKFISMRFQPLRKRSENLSNKTNLTLSFRALEKLIWEIKPRVFCRISSNRFQSLLESRFWVFSNSSSKKRGGNQSLARIWLLLKRLQRSKDIIKMHNLRTLVKQLETPTRKKEAQNMS